MMPRQHSEHKLQCAVMEYWRFFGRHDLACFAIANGELRKMSVAMRLKAEGVMPGVADLCVILDGGRTGWLELKAKGNSLTDAQKDFAALVQAKGHNWALVRSLEDAVAAFNAWNALRKRKPVLIEEVG